MACYKVMALIIPLLMPQSRKLEIRLLLQAAGSVMLPVLFFLALIANLSLAARGGDDCLGYTAVAVRPTGGQRDPHGQEPADRRIRDNQTRLE